MERQIARIEKSKLFSFNSFAYCKLLAFQTENTF